MIRIIVGAFSNLKEGSPSYEYCHFCFLELMPYVNHNRHCNTCLKFILGRFFITYFSRWLSQGRSYLLEFIIKVNTSRYRQTNYFLSSSNHQHFSFKEFE